MAAVFAHGALRLYLLALLEEGPKHGYEVIKALSDRFGGTYSPSAGTVYPRLAKLQEEGLVETALDGRRTIYTLTDAGRAEIADRREELAGLEVEIAASVRRLADDLRHDIRENMRSLRADLAAGAEAAKSRAKEPPARPGPGATQRRLRESELLLQKFRDDLRVDLRLQAAAAELSELTVETLRTILDQAAVAVRTTMKG
ncbi:PadR family transcriptional regulator [Arthrobacter sp. ERGS1:01]|uniref:PadR family transcriptional regulator n=1 Tax=Arthrobacter sp. ERGS1:01 TaxID=1704044 RepID=UPI0006B56998|nr:PadR family transcriptional regulator [Arthrobacter sp. ERGS1:01]ALE06624.1 PadR family transcriptional regulator [Arthrobacter sp. ERGS1:01]